MARWVLSICLIVGLAAFANAQEPAPQPGGEQQLPPVIVRPQEVPGEATIGLGGTNGNGSISWGSGAIGSFDSLVGSYAQPDWTTQRVFPTTRVYVLPQGTAELEQWVRPTWLKDGNTEYRMLEEFAVGLPGRFQLDLYERWNVEPDENNVERANHEGVQIELRWALANWGDIPFNPTLYAEWVERGGPQDKPNKYELKLLLGDNLTSKIFYATNFILEQEVAGDLETEVAWSHAITTPIIEEKLLAGLECRWAGITNKETRSDPTIEFLIGPSVHWRPTHRTFVDVVGLFGTTSGSPDAQMYFVFGYQFGERAGPSEGYRPASARGN